MPFYLYVITTFIMVCLLTERMLFSYSFQGGGSVFLSYILAFMFFCCVDMINLNFIQMLLQKQDTLFRLSWFHYHFMV